MRRTARALSVAALAGTVLGAAAPTASADPAAEVSPGTVSPGGSVTVSVSCDASGGSAPESIEGVSQAFEDGVVDLKRVSGNDEKAAGPAYSGTARVPAAEDTESAPESGWTVDGTCPAAAGEEGKEWSATFEVAGKGGGGGDGSGGGEAGKGDPEGGLGGGGGGSRTCDESGSDWSKSETGKREEDTGGTDAGTAAPGWEAPTGGDKTDPGWSEGGSHAEDCDDGGASTEHGVQAGTGGTFTDSVPALVAGGLLIAGAAGGAVYRLRRRTPAAED
ncbi:hypothetical protein [Streptomyces lanatus]|uniref:LPXTG cell wall anchor domain-containing protein n=1 Tax=Streptomyces lanatus TaxID=66900 RepID=A0ABV1XPJ5_9ACTN|nr:hypothetical protein [Streptomyces lanatus]GHG87154.1 hypothetical protein GCM10018780_04470 [Streptomyces lanatus]